MYNNAGEFTLLFSWSKKIDIYRLGTLGRHLAGTWAEPK